MEEVLINTQIPQTLQIPQIGHTADDADNDIYTDKNQRNQRMQSMTENEISYKI